MPTLNRAPNEREQQKLIEIFLKAETDIINEIGRLRSLGLADYHAVAALERVQAILKQMQDEAWEYVPQMIENEKVQPLIQQNIDEGLSKRLENHVKQMLAKAQG